MDEYGNFLTSVFFTYGFCYLGDTLGGDPCALDTDPQVYVCPNRGLSRVRWQMTHFHDKKKLLIASTDI